MKTVLVTGTDTGVGKTWIATLIARQLIRHGVSTGAYKPVCSGAETNAAGNVFWSDVDALQSAIGELSPRDLVCPQRFQAAVAPNVAAKLEGRTVDDHLLAAGVEPWRSIVDWLVVEGAGGIFCPLSDSSTVMDLAITLAGPIVVVAANRLGVINHTQLTVRALQSRGLNVLAIVLNEIRPPECSVLDPSIVSNLVQLQQWISDVPLYHCGWESDRILRVAGDAVSSEADFINRILKC